MYGFYYFSVQGNFKTVKENGKEENTKEMFLTESANYSDAEATVLKLLNETTQFPETIDVPRISRMDKVETILYNDLLEVSTSEKDGCMEYFINKENGIYLFSVKVQFEEVNNGKVKNSTSVYLVPGKSASAVEHHVNSSLRDCLLDYKITDVNATKFDTVVVLKESHKELVAKYDLIKIML